MKKFVAGHAAALVRDGMLVGVGTGSTVAFMIEELGRRVREEGLRVVGVPTSFQSRLLCGQLGIPVRDLGDCASLDLAIDGADEVDPDLNLIKGGGGSQTREKVVAAMAKEFVVVVDESKLVPALGTGFAIPIEVLPVALAYVERAVRDLGGSPAAAHGEGQGRPGGHRQRPVPPRHPLSGGNGSPARRPGASPNPRRAGDGVVLRLGQAGPGRSGRSRRGRRCGP